MSIVATRAIEMVHDVDPKKVLWDAVAPYLDDCHPTQAYVLVARYVRPEMTKGKIILPENQGTRGNDEFLGKAHLVLKCGPLAFYEENDGAVWGDAKPKVRDWVAIRPSDGMALYIGSTMCALVLAEAVRMIGGRPDIFL